MKKLLSILFLIPTLTLADGHISGSLPTLTDVSGVASNDVLNIRLGQHHTTDIVGTLAHDATGVEVVSLSEDARWALVNSAESSGWVRTKFLTEATLADWHDFDAALSCVGTEPFWSFGLNRGATVASFESIDLPAIGYDVDWTSGLIARPVQEIGLGGGTSSDGFSALIEQGLCSDGMSDRAFGLTIRLFIHTAGGTSGYGGCCSIQP